MKTFAKIKFIRVYFDSYIIEWISLFNLPLKKIAVTNEWERISCASSTIPSWFLKYWMQTASDGVGVPIYECLSRWGKV